MNPSPPPAGPGTVADVSEFTSVMADIAAAYDYPLADIGVYLQPLERARACFCQFAFPYDTEDKAAVAAVGDIHLAVSEALMALGGLFTTPYGPWAEMVYGRTATYTSTMKIVKSAFDPGNILNPGKLCF